MFDKDFVWGVAMSALQIEGARDKRGDTVWDEMCDAGACFEGHKADIACDHYNRYKKDVSLMHNLGVNAYRLSVNWSRIMKDGFTVNPEGVDFYLRLIDELLSRGIEPYVTLYHWEMPVAIEKAGGWESRKTAGYFYDYVKTVCKAFGKKVKKYITINEPQCVTVLGYRLGTQAPGKKLSGDAMWNVAHNLLLAHGMAVRAIRETNPDAQIGFAPTGCFFYPETDGAEDLKAARRAYFEYFDHIPNSFFSIPVFSDPVFFGEYPESAYGRLGTPPIIEKGDMELISQEIDFYCQNIYNGRAVRAGKDGIPEAVPKLPGYPRTAIDWPITPKSMYYGPKFLCERYKKPFYITENGMSCTDFISLDGKVHDETRIDFTARYLAEYEKIANENPLIRGYFHWSLLDNFEWSHGYQQRFGLVYVDYLTQKRTPKQSYYWYKGFIEKHKT